MKHLTEHISLNMVALESPVSNQNLIYIYPYIYISVYIYYLSLYIDRFEVISHEDMAEPKVVKVLFFCLVPSYP